MSNFKSYARAIDARAFIEARPELAAIDYTIEMNEGRAYPVFFVSSEAERAAIVAAQDAMPERKRAPFMVREDAEIEIAEEKEPEVKEEAKTMSERAMLCDLTIKGWSGRAQDKEAQSFTAMNFQANEEWIRVTKALVNKDALKAIKKIENEARKVHKTLTLPWNENGQRILAATAFQEYAQKMGDLRTEHERAVDAFIADYDDLVDAARDSLGGLFNPADYPEQAEMQAKFVFDTELSALDVTGDFRVKMADDELAALQAKITERTEARLSLAMSDVYKRLHEVVAHMSERLKAYKPKEGEEGKVENPFRDATLNNVRDIVDLMPKLNLTNDPALDQLASEVKNTLLEADAATLREDAGKRAEVAKAADDIANAMAGMM